MIKIFIINELVFRFDFIFRVIGNLVHIALIYFLWRSIYAGRGDIAGLEFIEAFTYMAISGMIFSLIETWAEWGLAHGIMSGEIIMALLVPTDMHIRTMSRSVAVFLSRLLTTGLPALLFLFLVFRVPFPGIGCFLLFLLSVLLSLLIYANFEFSVGVSAFGLESIIGVKFMKDAVIMFFSGAVIPLPFFPQAIQKILMVLPFQAMFHTPASIFLGRFPPQQMALMLLLQFGWFIFFMLAGRLYYSKMVHRLTINGG